MPSFQEKFLQTPHHRTIKAIIKDDAVLSTPIISVVKNIPSAARASMLPLLQQAVQAGKEWALQFLPWAKKARAYKFNIDRHVEDAVRMIGDRATKLLHNKTRNITHSNIIEDGKHLVRLKVIETYIKSSLEEWNNHGIEAVKRVELDDVKTCPICLHLNSKEYDIAQLVTIDNPLTHDSHPNCRGAFTPLVNNLSKVYKAFNPQPTTFDLATKNVDLKNAPIEYKPWLEQFFKRVSPNFSIEFASELSSDYKFDGKKLVIRYDALHDEDPREIITETMAKSVPSEIVKKTMKDYRNMMKLGLVTPPIETSNDSDMFTELYQQYLLNQLDDLYEVVYMKSFFDGTKYGKN